MYDKMNIITASDNNGVDMMAVAMYSVAKNNQHVPIKFLVIHTDISIKNQQRLKRIPDAFKNISVEFASAEKEKFSGVEVTNRNVSMPAYYRYLAPDILASEKRALYVDIDMLCLGSLDSLYRTNLGKNYVGAVEDYFISRTSDYPGFKAGIGLKDDDIYINSGLLLMNLELMRSSGVMEDFWQKIKEKSKIIPKKFNIFADQTVANLAFKNNIYVLDGRYNVLTTAMKYIKPKDVVIAHFTGQSKPFTYRDDATTPYHDEYYKYYNECMAIIGENDGLFIKSIIKKLGAETSNAVDQLVSARQIAKDKSHHVEELLDELDHIKKQLQESQQEADIAKGHLRSIQRSTSWRITRPLRLLGRIKPSPKQ